MRAALLALLLLPNSLQGGPNRPAAPFPVSIEIERQRKILESDETGYGSRVEAIERLASYEYAEAVSALLKRLESNVAEKREQRPGYSCTVGADGLAVTTITYPENYLLVVALSRLKAKEALPLLSEMLTLDEEHRGLSVDALLTHIISIKRANR